VEQNGSGGVFLYDKMKRLVDEYISVPNASITGNNVPNQTELPNFRSSALLHYEIDPVYNIKNVLKYYNGMKEEKIYQTNKKNQVIQVGNISVSWDGNGNMTSKSNGYQFKYDFQNRLKEATNPGGLTIQMVYDNFNRRIMKKMSNVQSQMSNIYIWDDDETIEEYQLYNSQTLKLSKQYVYGNEIDKKILATVDLDGNGQLETEYYFLQDQLGNVESIIGGDGRKLEEYEYQGYGNFKVYQPDNTPPQIEMIRGLSYTIGVLFNEPLVYNSVQEGLKVYKADGTYVGGQWDGENEDRYWRLGINLEEGETYKLVITNALMDKNLNRAEAKEVEFVYHSDSIIYDNKSPEVEEVFQINGQIMVKFTEEIDGNSVVGSSIKVYRNNQLINGTTEVFKEDILQFTADQDLIEGLEYKLQIGEEVKDLSGKGVSPIEISFTYTKTPVLFYKKPDQRIEISATAYNNFHLFQGREFDKELDLYYFRNRYLDNNIGVWITNDLARYKDKYNLYQGFSLNPINYSDPFGLWTKDGIKNILFKSKNSKKLMEVLSKLYKEPHIKNILDKQLDNANEDKTIILYYDRNLYNKIKPLEKLLKEVEPNAVRTAYYIADQIFISCSNIISDNSALISFIHEFTHWYNDKRIPIKQSIYEFYFSNTGMNWEDIRNKILVSKIKFSDEASAFYMAAIAEVTLNSGKKSEFLEINNMPNIENLIRYTNELYSEKAELKYIKIGQTCEDCEKNEKIMNYLRKIGLAQ